MTDHLDVYLDGTLAGRLTPVAGGRVAFDYTAEGDTALSTSMPRSSAHHHPDVVDPWLDNLLPDSDAVRARWAASFGLRRPNPFDLLKYVGADCPGAVQIVPAGTTPVQVGELTPVSESDIAAHIRALRADPDAWRMPHASGQWSLGGQQGKFALARRADGAWMVPSGRAASTHIVKVGVAGLPNADVAEYVTMRVAAQLGLPVPPVEFPVIAGEPALVISRFDRLADGAQIRRLHQEDLCQALGLWRAAKYQADGGPSVADVTGFFRRVLDPRDRARGVTDFARNQVFNWLVAGTDAHAKNFAILHIGPRIVAAPFYDLISTALLWPANDVHFNGRMAMKFGGEYKLRKVDRGRIKQEAADLGVDEGLLEDTVRVYSAELPNAAQTAIDELPVTVSGETRSSMIRNLLGRLEMLDKSGLAGVG